MGKRLPGVFGELVKRLLFKGCRHGLAFLIISSASSGGNTTLSAGSMLDSLCALGMAKLFVVPGFSEFVYSIRDLRLF